MFWPIFIYIILSVIIAGSALLKVGFGVGFYAFAASALALVAGGGLKASLWYGDKAQKIAGPIIATVIMAVALWLASGFSAQLFGYAVSGTMWCIVGAAVCFIFVNRKLAA
jgi:hypothetical protein